MSLRRLKTQQMAEGGGDYYRDRPSKKRKTEKNEFFVKLNDDKRDGVLSAIKALNSKETGLSLLKLVFCNAGQAACFSDSTCFVKRNPPKLYKFFSIFKRGKEVLMSYLESGYTNSLTAAEKVSLEKLFYFLNHIEDTSEKLRTPKCPIEREIDWTLQLCHHVLKGLSKHEHYIVDDKAPYLGSIDLTKYCCPCCRQVLTGNTGDTSIGNTSVWHGRVDVLIGPLAVIDANAADPDSPDIFSSSSLEIKYKRKKLRELPQLISETIVFAFLKKKNSPNLKSALIPTIGFSYKTLMFQFYDSVQDILIDSELFNLIDVNDEFLAFETVLAIWLAMNHELFCTGVTSKMLEADFKADFTSFVPPEVLHIYKNDLTFGGCASVKHSSGAIDLDGYILESDEDD